MHLTYVRDTEHGPEEARITLVNGKGEVTPNGHAILDLIENFGSYLKTNDLEDLADEIGYVRTHELEDLRDECRR